MGKHSVAVPTVAATYSRKQLKVNLHTNMAKMFSASGNNAVAIDNKIEQAMDLVKSHLMFAVREEVEVLKEKIAELMERISHLEVENNLLRSHASQETLSQLSSLPSQQPPGAATYQQPPNGSVS